MLWPRSGFGIDLDQTKFKTLCVKKHQCCTIILKFESQNHRFGLSNYKHIGVVIKLQLLISRFSKNSISFEHCILDQTSPIATVQCLKHVIFILHISLSEIFSPSTGRTFLPAGSLMAKPRTNGSTPPTPHTHNFLFLHWRPDSTRASGIKKVQVMYPASWICCRDSNQPDQATRHMLSEDHRWFSIVDKQWKCPWPLWIYRRCRPHARLLLAECNTRD